MCNDVSEPLYRACAGRKTCVRTATIEPNEQGAGRPNTNALGVVRALLQDIELMPQYQDFGFQPPP
jgi:hypothetical protein